MRMIDKGLTTSDMRLQPSPQPGPAVVIHESPEIKIVAFALVGQDNNKEIRDPERYKGVSACRKEKEAANYVPSKQEIHGSVTTLDRADETSVSGGQQTVLL